MRADGLDKFFNIEEDEDDKLIEDAITITDDNLEDIITAEPQTEILPPVVIEEINEIENTNQEELTDSDFVRKKLKTILNQAEVALEVAIKSQEEEEGRPRNTDAIAGIMDTMNKTLSELVSLNKVESDLALKKGGKVSPIDGASNIINNTLIMTPEDAIKQITEGMKNKN